MLTRLAPQLRERGIELPVNDRQETEPNLCRLVKRLRPPSGLDNVARNVARPEIWRFVAAQLRRSRARRFVISEELLLGRPARDTPKRVRELAEFCGASVRLLAYVRPQYQFLESRYTDFVRGGGTALPFHAFAAASFAVRPVERHPWLNYQRVFAPWRALFGNRLTVVPLERSRLPRGLLAHFLEELGAGDLDPGAVEPVNTRAGAKALEVHRRTGAALQMRGRYAGEKRQVRWRRMVELVDNDRPFAGLTADEAHAIMARFAASNSAFAREYGIDTGNVLFRDPVIDHLDRPNIASWYDLDDGERTAARAFVRQTVGIDPQPRMLGRVRRRLAEAAVSGRPGPEFGSARWHARWLLDPRFPLWRLLLRRSLKRRRIAV